MIINSTHFLNYSEIKVDETDLYEDAFGLYPEINDVTGLDNKPEPESELVNKLIERIRKNE